MVQTAFVDMENMFTLLETEPEVSTLILETFVSVKIFFNLRLN